MCHFGSIYHDPAFGEGSCDYWRYPGAYHSPSYCLIAKNLRPGFSINQVQDDHCEHRSVPESSPLRSETPHGECQVFHRDIATPGATWAFHHASEDQFQSEKSPLLIIAVAS